jgi:hypothetical protein
VSWDYSWQVGPKGGTLIDLDDYAIGVRWAAGAETIAPKRGINQVSPYRHGTLTVPHKFTSELVIPLEIAYRYTDETGTVDHSDGAAGHVYENKATVEKALFGTKGLATLRRVVPDFGTCEAYVEQLAPSMPTQARHIYLYLLTAHEGSWKSTVESTSTSTPVSVGGNHPTAPTVEIVGGTNVYVELSADSSRVSITGATPAGGVSVNCETGVITQISGGDDYGEFVSFTKPYGLLLEPGDNAYTTGGSPTSVTFKYHARLR